MKDLSLSIDYLPHPGEPRMEHPFRARFYKLKGV